MRDLEQRRKQAYYERRQALYKEQNDDEQPKKGRFSWKWIVVALLLVLVLVVTYGFYDSNFTWETTQISVKSPNIPNSFNGFKIAVVSDLHAKDYGEDNKELSDAILAEKPDMVVITGDLIDKDTTDDQPVLRFVSTFAHEIPTYFISGNHEQHRAMLAGESTPDIWTELQNIGVTVLENKTVTIRRLGDKIALTGLREDYELYREKAEDVTLPVETFAGPADADTYQILLAHNPLYWKDYIEWGADLTISGHVHGGGIWLPGLGGIFSPEVSLFPKYQRGLYTDSGSQMVVSAGLGNSGTPFRLFNTPELVIVTLKSLNVM